jgi:hypothetical protein
VLPIIFPHCSVHAVRLVWKNPGALNLSLLGNRQGARMDDKTIEDHFLILFSPFHNPFQNSCPQKNNTKIAKKSEALTRLTV